MSNFIKRTKNPRTGEWDDNAEWLDNYYGRHRYAVQFSNGDIIDPKSEPVESEEIKPNELLDELIQELSEMKDQLLPVESKKV